MAGKRKETDDRREKIRQDLIDQLERNGVYGSYYRDLVEDYMALWDVKERLIKDIRKRGVTAKYQNGPDQWGYKKNDSVAELNKTNAQMLRLLKDLGLRVSDKPGDEFDDEEM